MSQETIFEGKMTKEDYALIFNRAKTEFSLLTVEEKVERRKRLHRAILNGKVEMHALDIAINEDIEKADEETKKRLKKEIKPVDETVKKETERLSAKERALEKAAEALGMSVIEFKKKIQKVEINNALEARGETKTRCGRHDREFEKLSDGVGCSSCEFEEKNGYCVYHASAMKENRCEACDKEGRPVR